MPSIEPYATCPCGSGKKFKWCCQKVEPYAEKAWKLFESGQFDATITALDEGLAREPGNPWLTFRKAIVLTQLGRDAEAADVLRKMLADHPENLTGRLLLIRSYADEGKAPEAIANFQDLVETAGDGSRDVQRLAAEMVGSVAARTGQTPGALMYLELAQRLGRGDEQSAGTANLLSVLRANASIPLVLRESHRLAPPPADLAEPQRAAFLAAMDRARRGAFRAAAEQFAALAAATPLALRNEGLCRVWIADMPGAVRAIRAAIAAPGSIPDAVSLEGLCQLIAPATDEDLVESVHLIWTLRDREALLRALQARPDVVAEGQDEIDLDDHTSFEVDSYALLDSPPPAEPPASIRELPKVLARIHVGKEIVILDSVDDGRLDRMTGRFIDLAGNSIPPAQPRTRMVSMVSRAALENDPERMLPDNLPTERLHQYRNAEIRRRVFEEWADQPNPSLGGRTPRQAARDGDAEIPLRAQLGHLAPSGLLVDEPLDLSPLYRELNLAEETAPDLSTTALDDVPLDQLARLDPAALDDDQLITLYRIGQAYLIRPVLERAAPVILSRPALVDGAEPRISRVLVASDLALLRSMLGRHQEAIELARSSRDADPAGRTSNGVQWELLELGLRTRSEAPEVWVPLLASTFERHRGDQRATAAILRTCMDLGLVEIVADPSGSGEPYLDTRKLQAVLAEYGPRITRADGTLGVTAGQGGIWTPDSGSGSTTPGGIWTPGAPSEGPGDKPKLIIPGR